MDDSNVNCNCEICRYINDCIQTQKEANRWQILNTVERKAVRTFWFLTAVDENIISLLRRTPEDLSKPTLFNTDITDDLILELSLETSVPLLSVIFFQRKLFVFDILAFVYFYVFMRYFSLDSINNYDEVEIGKGNVLSIFLRLSRSEIVLCYHKCYPKPLTSPGRIVFSFQEFFHLCNMIKSSYVTENFFILIRNCHVLDELWSVLQTEKTTVREQNTMGTFHELYVKCIICITEKFPGTDVHVLRILRYMLSQL